MPDPNKICFIICYNDELFLEECCLYINSLFLPPNMERNIITIKEAASITEGYQSGMEASDARYKVYLHQDTFILNVNFIPDIIKIFSEEDIGMIGVVGAVEMPKDGVMWLPDKRCGLLRVNQILYEGVASFPIPITGDYREVVSIDGLIMATSADIPWRTDLFQGWHFYDVSQSYEFQKAGYRVVVPKQETPWCLHDIDVPNSDPFVEYERWRRIFVENYSEYL